MPHPHGSVQRVVLQTACPQDQQSTGNLSRIGGSSHSAARERNTMLRQEENDVSILGMDSLTQSTHPLGRQKRCQVKRCNSTCRASWAARWNCPRHQISRRGYRL